MPACNFSIPCSNICEDPIACQISPAFSMVNEFGSAIQATCPPGPLGQANGGTALQASADGGIGVLGLTRSGIAAVLGETGGSGSAIQGIVEPTGTGNAGLFVLENPQSHQSAVEVSAIRGPGINARSEFDAGIVGRSTHLVGVAGIGGNSADAGLFIGTVTVAGLLQASVKQFVIDHPLDPANRLLTHASVESSEMANVYSGNARLDGNGEAWVELPKWLEALNSDFRYQLTCIGRAAPVYIAQEVASNRFRIAGGEAGMTVSWQLTGIRNDPFAKAHPLIVEEVKPANERGFYRHPDIYNQPDDEGIHRRLLRRATRTLP